MLLLLAAEPAPDLGAALVELVLQVDPSPDVDVETATIELELVVGAAHGSARTLPGEYEDPDDAPGYEVFLADHAGPVSPLPFANVKSIEWSKNIEEVFEIEVPKDDPGTADLIGDELVEVQVYRNGDLKAWGPLIGDSADAAGSGVSLAGRGTYWYLRAKRQFGDNVNGNRLPNGDFEDGLEGWEIFGANAAIGTYSEAEIPSTGLPLIAPRTGSRAFYALGGVGAGRYLSARFAHLAGPGYGNRVDVSGWVNFAYYTGPSISTFGLILSVWYFDVEGNLIALRMEGAEDVIPDLKAVADTDDPGVYSDQWLEVKFGIALPDAIVSAPLVGSIEIRIYLPGGIVALDSFAAYSDTATIPNRGEDQAAYAGRIVNYAQTGPGKSDLNIGTTTPPTGVTVGPYPEDSRDAYFVHSKHQKIGQAIEEIALHPLGFDHRMIYTPTSRTWSTVYPRQGVDRRADLTFRLGRPEDGGTLAGYSRSRSWEEVENSIVVRAKTIGTGDETVTIPEAFAQDLTGSGGLVLEGVVDAPDTLAALDLIEYAADEVRDHRRPIPVLEFTTYADLVDVVGLGDLVTVEITDGAIVETHDVEIVKIRLETNPEVLKLTVNVWRS